MSIIMKNILYILLGIIVVPALVYSASVFTTRQGGTGTGTPPTLGQILLGNADGTYSPVATSSLGIVASGGSGNSAWTIGNGLIYNATSSDKVGIGTSTPVALLTVQGTTTVPFSSLFTVASSTGGILFNFGSNGRLGFGTSTPELASTSTQMNVLDVFARSYANNTLLSAKIASSSEFTLQPSFTSRRISMWTSGGSATGYQYGLSQTSSSTGVDTVPTFTNSYTAEQRTLFSTVITTFNQQVGIRSNVNFYRSATTSVGGFFAVADFGFTSWTAGNRFYTGFSTCTAGDCIASSTTIVNRQDIAGFLVDGMTNTLTFATNDNSGVISTTSISGMPAFSANSKFRTYIYSPAGDPNIYWRIDNRNTNVKIAEGVATSNLMRQNVNHAYINLCSNGANTAANACQLGMMRFYIESQ